MAVRLRCFRVSRCWTPSDSEIRVSTRCDIMISGPYRPRQGPTWTGMVLYSMGRTAYGPWLRPQLGPSMLQGLSRARPATRTGLVRAWFGNRLTILGVGTNQSLV